jgi:hypothetical protein
VGEVKDLSKSFMLSELRHYFLNVPKIVSKKKGVDVAVHML